MRAHKTEKNDNRDANYDLYLYNMRQLTARNNKDDEESDAGQSRQRTQTEDASGVGGSDIGSNLGSTFPRF